MEPGQRRATTTITIYQTSSLFNTSVSSTRTRTRTTSSDTTNTTSTRTASRSFDSFNTPYYGAAARPRPRPQLCLWVPPSCVWQLGSSSALGWKIADGIL
ncbi:hypothetical protein CVT26_010628 [Gymnopilus dilepis]|uniref:Uncharacterized protein n=1 Tax=Gymnopilus dilepis TaxID=231916 RepID=A0A409W592_9AGAR|nr:hypothetical protein CVT26_010628 [Gymnopilus dilepis]